MAICTNITEHGVVLYLTAEEAYDLRGCLNKAPIGNISAVIKAMNSAIEPKNYNKREHK